MRHPFENRHSIFWLGGLVALLVGYFFLAIPHGPVPVVKTDALIGTSALQDHHATISTNPRAQVPVPTEGVMAAMAIGVVALIMSVGPFVGALPRRKAVHWIGPRSRAS